MPRSNGKKKGKKGGKKGGNRNKVTYETIEEIDLDHQNESSFTRIQLTEASNGNVFMKITDGFITDDGEYKCPGKNAKFPAKTFTISFSDDKHDMENLEAIIEFLDTKVGPAVFPEEWEESEEDEEEEGDEEEV